MVRALDVARTTAVATVTVRRGLAVGAAVLALVGLLGATSVPTFAASAASGGCATRAPSPVHTGHFLGIARPVHMGVHCPANVRTPSSSPVTGPSSTEIAASTYPGTPPLINHGGPVMATPSADNQVVVTPIYWAPSGYSFTSSYQRVINTYLAGLAADSERTGNVFSTTFQYSGSNGAINYRMTRGTPIADAHAFPSAGCTTSAGAIYANGTGYKTCLDDDQVESEIASVVASQGLRRDLGHLYVILLPQGVESCFYPLNPAGQQCSINSTPSGAFCAYHSAFFGASDETVYANLPFPIYSSATGYSCTDEGLGGVAQIQQPNGDPDADVEVSPLSHEMAEAITDPNGDAWYDSSGYENGDDCAYIFGALSGSAGAYFNQTVNGAHYLTQEEFSNSDFAAGRDGCQQSSPALRPTVTGLSPATGPDTGGTSVTITGVGFPGATAVKFGSNTAGFTIVNATHITATVPAGTAGTVDVTVATSAGSSTSASADHYTYTSATPVPTVTGVSPNSGATAGGTTVTITGSHLSGATAVAFAGRAATAFTVVDSQHITAKAPAAVAAGTVDITVTTGGGTSPASSADHFRYQARAHVTSLSVHSGPQAGGTRVVITGTGFSRGAVVRFGTRNVAVVSVRSSIRIVVHSPRHARGTVDVVVFTAGGNSPHSKGDRYRYI